MILLCTEINCIPDTKKERERMRGAPATASELPQLPFPFPLFFCRPMNLQFYAVVKF